MRSLIPTRYVLYFAIILWLPIATGCSQRAIPDPAVGKIIGCDQDLDLDEVIKKATRLEPGMTRRQVSNILGMPGQIYGKTSWVYYVRICGIKTVQAEGPTKVFEVKFKDGRYVSHEETVQFWGIGGG